MLKNMNLPWKTLNQLFQILKMLEYGFIDSSNNITKNPQTEKDDYRVASVDEMLKYKIASSLDRVELERSFLHRINIIGKSYIVASDKNMHAFLIFGEKEQYYLIESLYPNINSIQSFPTLKEAIAFEVNLFMKKYQIESIQELSLVAYGSLGFPMTIDKIRQQIIKNHPNLLRNPRWKEMVNYEDNYQSTHEGNVLH